MVTSHRREPRATRLHLAPPAPHLAVEDVISSKKRFQYEEVVKRDPYMYDTWYDYVRLEESFIADAATPDFAAARDVYERAISNVPPAPEKRLWRRCVLHVLACDGKSATTRTVASTHPAASPHFLSAGAPSAYRHVLP